jgi:Saxitoxin biosynthesis operon protein SxtJ
LTRHIGKKRPARGADKAEVTDKQARKTALIVAAVLFLLAAWNIYRGRTTVVVVLGGFAVLLTLVGLFVPVVARAFHRLWMGIASVLGYINSRILFSVLFYGVFTPYNLVSRLLGRDQLRRRGAGEPTYWVKRESTRQTKEQFERLF